MSLSLYIHWPFCLSKCPYCDFNSHVRDSIDYEKYLEAFKRELQNVSRETFCQSIKSIFFGGGTPSLMPPSLVRAIIEEIKSLWPINGNLEITLEANPNSVEMEKFYDLKAAGVNRLSLGIQSLNNQDLQFLGRTHKADEAQRAIEIARTVFDRYSFDLIYALPNQKIENWQEELTNGLKLAGTHLSLYQLTIEEGTPFFHRHQRGEFHLPDEDLSALFYEETQRIMEAHGLPAYEISNHAVPGFECQHNLVYWRYQDYAGIGPGAHGRLSQGQKRYATYNHRAPETWVSHVLTHGHGLKERVELTSQDQGNEALLMGLRLKEGIPLHRLAEFYQSEYLPFDPHKLGLLKDEGLVSPSLTHLQLTPLGLQKLNGILKYLLSA